MFLELCLGSIKSPSTARNYVSSLTSAYNRMGLDASPFSKFKVRNALLSIDKNVRHTPSGALPVSAALLKKAVRVIRRLPNGSSVAAAVIIMFHTFHRQSNFSAPSAINFDPARQITRGDVRLYPDRLQVSHKWSKSHQMSGHHAVTSIPAIPGNPLCPRQAYIDMVRDVPSRSPHQPLIMFRDGNNIPLPYLRRVWNTVMRALKVPQYDRYTLHGLRRGGATHVFQSDPSTRDEIKRHGLWRSNCVDRYLPASCPKVFALMKETL